MPMFVVSVFWCAFTASGALLVAWGVCCIVVICVLLCMVGWLLWLSCIGVVAG